MKSKIIKLLKIAEEPQLFFNKKAGKNYIHFGDVNRGEHIVPLSDIRLSSQFIKEALSPEEEPEFRYYVYISGNMGEIEITGCMWFDLQEILLKGDH